MVKNIRKMQLFNLWVLLLLIFVPTGSILAEDGSPPPDPGAGTAQDGLIGSTTLWVLPSSQVFSVYLADTNYVLNWTSLDFIATSTLEDGRVEFIGAGYSSSDLLDANGDGFVLDENGEVVTLDYCDDAWVTPGLISLEAVKNFPENAVVVSQDPDNNGVNLTWEVRLFPTTFNYEVWEQIPYSDDNPGDKTCKHENAECKINESGKECCGGLICVPFNDSSGNGKCRVDVNALPWGCSVETISYPEEFVTVNTGAVLSLPSRQWIIGPLALAYPGSHLKHPDWGFSAGGGCVWEGDVCVLTHSEDHVQVVDPGFYDLSVTGVTSGTAVSPPRTFGLTGGKFGVFLLDNSMINSQ